MAEPKKAIVGKVVSVGKNAVPAVNPIEALTQIVDCVKAIQVEGTKRKRLSAYETTEIARIKAAEVVLRDYFAESFRERRKNFDEMFQRLDSALEQGNGEAAAIVVRGIVDIARESPLANMGDLGQIRAALDDPNQVWEL
ncbi:MAG TPA: hypothetical protein P5074_09985 [Candidatus Nanopelagicales bacterium]|nr:hypothetical protein [Candidatus Nanopelagicales bacterium]